MKQVREKEKATVVLLATLYAADKYTFEVLDNDRSLKLLTISEDTYR